MNDHVISRRAFLATAGGITANALLLRDSAGNVWNPSSSPMVAAESIFRLEVTPLIPALSRLSALMHPDAQAIIPRNVVVHYIHDAFQTRSPRMAVAMGVTWKEWTWGVNGITYPVTAEVSFRQEDDDGIHEDVLHLVKDGDAWKWFFGRDRAWVDRQIQRFTQTADA